MSHDARQVPGGCEWEGWPAFRRRLGGSGGVVEDSSDTDVVATESGRVIIFWARVRS